MNPSPLTRFFHYAMSARRLLHNPLGIDTSHLDIARNDHQLPVVPYSNLAIRYSAQARNVGKRSWFSVTQVPRHG